MSISLYILNFIDQCSVDVFITQNSDTLLEIEFMKCELMVKSLGEKKENYSKSVVEVSCALLI